MSEDTKAENKSYKENIIFNIPICQSNTILVVVSDLIAWSLAQQTALWGIHIHVQLAEYNRNLAGLI